jgi:hypothetical protein
MNRRLGHADESHEHNDAEMMAETTLKLPKSHSEFIKSCNLRRGEAGNFTLKDMTKDPRRRHKRKIWSKEHGDGGNKNRGERAAFCASKEKSPVQTRPKASGFVNCSKANCKRGFKSSTSENEFKNTSLQNSAHEP